MLNMTSKEFANAVRQGKAVSGMAVMKEAFALQTADMPSNTLQFVFSTDSVDRSGDRVMPDGLDFSNYMERNSLILLHHDLHSFPIARTIALGVQAKSLVGTIEFFTDLDEGGVGTNARAALELIKRGTMGLSITFIPKDFELNTTDGLDFMAGEIVETSVVSVPCNRDAFRIPSEPVTQDSSSHSVDTQRLRHRAWRQRVLAMSILNT